MVEDGPGLKLCASFFTQVVEPILARHVPGLRYAAARIGRGSEVLGYDTEMSADHDYGPSLQLFLQDAVFAEAADSIVKLLDRELPGDFEGWPVRFAAGTRKPCPSSRPGAAWSHHGVEVYTVGGWCDRFLQHRCERELEWRDWLSYPEQNFLLVTAGRVFRDDPGELTALRERLKYFPRDVWLYKLTVQWSRIAEESGYIGRAGGVGDEIGSAVIAARMVENMMRLALLLERRYAPYPKWLGTAFAQLSCAAELSPIFQRVLSAPHWPEREAAVYDACRFLALLQVVKKVPGATSPRDGALHSRPFRFIDTPRISNDLRAAIEDDEVRGLPDIGGADQFLSSNFVKAVPDVTRAAFSALVDAGFWKQRPAR